MERWKERRKERKKDEKWKEVTKDGKIRRDIEERKRNEGQE